MTVQEIPPSCPGLTRASTTCLTRQTWMGGARPGPTRKKEVDGGDEPGHDGRMSIVIWTTTPWTLPGNRAISFSPKIAYGLYRVTDAPADNWAKNGDLLILSDTLAESVFKQARVTAY